MADVHRSVVRVLVAAVTILLVVPGPSSAGAADERPCGPDDVVVVVEPASLGGGPLVRCATGVEEGDSGLDALAAAGLDVEENRAANALVCRIDGQPEASQESCGASLSGDGYWAFLVAQEGYSWLYATHGLRDHEVEPGEFLALRYQLLADGEDVAIDTPADADTRAAAQVVENDPDDVAGSTGYAVGWVEVVVLVVVLVGLLLGASVLAVRRRRRR